ncbi:MAG: hypothetical protein WCG25_03650 [bacterium]
MNKKLSQETLEDAKRKADMIIEHASTETKRIQDELTKNRELSVKNTTKLVVKKIFNEKKDLQDDYINTIIKDLN